jgi:hypothetical protein
MAKLTKEQRDKLPAEDFGDPKKRLFPITDQDSLDAAARLHGHADDPIAVKAAIKAIADKKGLAVPDAWQDDEDDEGQGGKGKGADAEYEGDDAGMSAVFSLSSAAAANAPDGFVLRKAPVIFRAGVSSRVLYVSGDSINRRGSKAVRDRLTIRREAERTFRIRFIARGCPEGDVAGDSESSRSNVVRRLAVVVESVFLNSKTAHDTDRGVVIRCEIGLLPVTESSTRNQRLQSGNLGRIEK